MKNLLLILIIFLSFTTSVAFGDETGKTMLKQFLYSAKITEREHAFSVIASNKGKYGNVVLAELQLYVKKPGKTPDGLLYLAALIKDRRYIRPLVTLINNDDYSADHCIYSCPIVFSIVVLSSFTDYTVSGLNDNSTAVHDYASEYAIVKNISVEPEDAGKYATGPGIDPLLDELEALPLSDVIKIAGPHNSDTKRRMAAAFVLQAHIVDDKHLNELYWLAISDLSNDASAEYRNALHWAIYKAETYRKLKRS